MSYYSGYALRVLMQTLIAKAGCDNFRELHSWSVANPGKFRRQAWLDLGIVGDSGAIDFSGSGFSETRWFPEAKLNVVNTLLAGDQSKEVLVAYSEAGPRVAFTLGELKQEVAACAAALKAAGVNQKRPRSRLDDQLSRERDFRSRSLINRRCCQHCLHRLWPRCTG